MLHLRKKIPGMLYAILTGFLFAVGLGLPLYMGAGLQSQIPQFCLWCMAFSVIFILLFTRMGCSAFFVSFLLFSGAFALSQFIESGICSAIRTVILALYQFKNGNPLALSVYRDLLAPVLAFGLTLIGMLVASGDTPVSLGLFLYTGGCVGMAIAGLSKYLIFSLPSVLAIVLLGACTYTDEKKKLNNAPFKAFPVAMIAIVAALLLVPQEGTKVPALAAFREKIRALYDDYFFFNQERERYRMDDTGWMPLENSRLGGKPSEEDADVLQVETSEPLYLRGAVLDAYTGAAWYDSISTQRYQWQSFRYRNEKNQLFDMDYPLVSGNYACLNEKTARVTLLIDSKSTLFVPQRLREIESRDGMILFFNTSTELFIPHNLKAGDSYSVTYLSMNATDEGMAELVAANAEALDENYDGIAEIYTKLPSHIQQEVYDIAEKATEGCETPWQKAAAIRRYLRKNYTYNLDVQMPPTDVDFVAWFLLAEKEGYCTYFATAMTVLCRIAGIPARYVEGFIVDPKGETSVTVTSKSAHAWTEIYLNGVGWVTIDATPSDDSSDLKDSQPSSGEGEDKENQPEKTSTPEPAATPTPAPQSENATPSPSPDSVTPTPTPVPETDETPKPTDQPDKKDSDGPNGIAWLLLLLLLLLILAIACLVRVTDPLYRAGCAKTSAQAVMILWHGTLLAASGTDYRSFINETPLDYAERLEAISGFSAKVTAENVSILLYSEKHATAANVREAEKLYTAMLESLSFRDKARFVTVRILKFIRERFKK